MKKLLAAILLTALPMASSHAALITVGTTVLGDYYTTDFVLNYDDSDNNLNLSLSELTNITWEQAHLTSGAVTTGVSAATSISSGGGPILTVSPTNVLVSSTDGYFAFSTTGGNIGFQGFASSTFINWWNSCSVSCGPQTPFSEFEVTGASAVPLPAAAWLFGSGLLGLISIARRNKAA